MVEKFEQKHGQKPQKIVIAPMALVTLGIKKSVAPIWAGVPVECRLFEDREVVRRGENKARSLGVFLKERRGKFVLAACDLR